MTHVFYFENPGAPTVVAIAGWGTGPHLFSGLRDAFNLVVAVPIDPEGCAAEVGQFLIDHQLVPDLALGVSMGAPIALKIGIKKTVVIGLNFGFSQPVLRAIDRQLGVKGLGYLDLFLDACVSTADDRAWVSGMGSHPWTLAHLKRDLVFLGQNQWRDAERLPCCVVHSTDDQIAPFDPVQTWATGMGLPFFALDGAGHLPFGPDSIALITEIMHHELAT